MENRHCARNRSKSTRSITRARSISSKKSEVMHRQHKRSRKTTSSSERYQIRRSRSKKRREDSHRRRRKSRRERQRSRSHERDRSQDKNRRRKRRRSLDRTRGDHTIDQSQVNKFPMLGNVVPEFDPMVKSQTIHMWLSKVEECAGLYSWGDDQIIHYALPKLSGVAKSWYQALPSMSFSWQEWRTKLIESFPSSGDYAELLTEMLSRRVKYNESLELYYYDKINLLNRCEIEGKRAVDCLLYGIDDRSLRLGAKAVKCQKPEQVLEYFLSINQQTRDTDKSIKLSYDRKTSNVTGNTNLIVKQSEFKTFKPQTVASVKCYNCNESGHYSFKCTKKILKCNICNKLGHTSVDCPRLPGDKNKFDTVA